MGIVHGPGVSGLYANWATIPHKRPPPISQHLYPKHQTFPTQSPTIGTWGKQPPLISCHNHFLASWQLYSFPLILNTCNSLWALLGALVAGREKEAELASTSLECEYLHSFEKVDAKCWLAEMTLVDGQPQGNWRWNSNSRDIVASSPFFSSPCRQSAPES